MSGSLKLQTEFDTMVDKQSISVAHDFNKFPFGRFDKDGEFNGTRFRDQYLEPKLREVAEHGDVLVVDLDGVGTLGNSFIEEAFGGLVRVSGFERDFLEKHLEVTNSTPSGSRWVRSIWTQITLASQT